MTYLYNVGGNICKSLFGLYLLSLVYGELKTPTFSLSEGTLRIEDSSSGAEFLFSGELLSMEPVHFHVKRIEMLREPKLRPPLRRRERKIFFGASTERLENMLGESKIVSFFKPRRPIFFIKHAEKGDLVYYRRRFGKPEREEPYDFLFLSSYSSLSIKCFSARFITEPRPFRRIRSSRIVSVDLILALDPTRNVLAIIEANTNTILDIIRLEASVPSLYLYLESLIKRRKYLIEELIGYKAIRTRKPFIRV